MAHSQAENDTASREEDSIFLPDLFDADTNLHSLHRLPKQSTDYATAGYWENRYAHEDGLVYDWYGVEYSDFRTHLLKWRAGIGPRTVLEIGSGNSEWSDRMAADGLFVTSTDISSLVLENMAGRMQPEGSGAVERVCMDVCRLPFREELFDFVVDKGTMDALSCSQSSRSDSSSFCENQAMAAEETTTSMPKDEAELHRVAAPLKLLSAAWSVWKALKVGGCWFVLTAKAPETLLRAMRFGETGAQTPSFEVQHSYLSNGTFLVRLKKKAESDSLT